VTAQLPPIRVAGQAAAIEGRAAAGEGRGELAGEASDGAGAGDTVATAYAGVVTRAIALAVDALLIDVAALAVAGAVLLVFSVFSVSGKQHPIAVVVEAALFVVWVVSYFGVFWTTTGQTPGSRVMQIRVVRADGTRLRPRHALVRLAGMVISLPLFWGYWPILTTRRRRGVFDVLAGTVVTIAAPAADQAAQAVVERRTFPG
jgi:uncharacterized RDD family membrane protein YckC